MKHSTIFSIFFIVFAFLVFVSDANAESKYFLSEPARVAIVQQEADQILHTEKPKIQLSTARLRAELKAKSAELKWYRDQQELTTENINIMEGLIAQCSVLIEKIADRDPLKLRPIMQFVVDNTESKNTDNLFLKIIKGSLLLGTIGGVQVRGVKTVGQVMAGVVVPIPVHPKLILAPFVTYGGIFGQNGLNHQLTQNGMSFLTPIKGWLVGPAVAYSRVLIKDGKDGKDIQHIAVLGQAIKLPLFLEAGYAFPTSAGAPGLVQFRVGVAVPNAKIKKGIGKIFKKIFGR